MVRTGKSHATKCVRSHFVLISAETMDSTWSQGVGSPGSEGRHLLVTGSGVQMVNDEDSSGSGHVTGGCSTAQFVRRTSWIQPTVLLAVCIWIICAHVQMASYNQELEQMAHHVTILQRHLRRVQQSCSRQHGVLKDIRNVGDVRNAVDTDQSYSEDITSSRRVTPSRRRRAGHRPSSIDDGQEKEPEVGSQQDDGWLKAEQRKHCQALKTTRAAEVSCQKSVKLVSEVKRYLISVIQRTNAVFHQEMNKREHPSVHLIAIGRREPYMQYLAWNASNPMSHITTNDGHVTGLDQAYDLDGTRQMVRIKETGRYLVYAQVTFMGRNEPKDTFETLDCGFRIVIARSIRYGDNMVGLFYAQTTQYGLGVAKHSSKGLPLFPQDSAYVSGVYPFQSGDELAIDMDRGVLEDDSCRVNYDAAKTFFGILRISNSD